MKVKKLLLFSIVMIGVSVFMSCNTDEDLIVTPEKEISCEYTQSFSYKGNLYEFDFVEYADETIEFLGDTLSENFKTINAVMQSDSLSTLTITDRDVLYLFDNKTLREEYVSTIRQPLKSNLKSVSMCIISLFVINIVKIEVCFLPHMNIMMV